MELESDMTLKDKDKSSLMSNAGILSDAAAGALYATGFGAPLATAVLAAGNTAQQVGGRVKDARQRAKAGIQQINQIGLNAANSISSQGQAIQGQIKQQAQQQVSQLNQKALQLKNQAINGANDAIASATNQLKTQANNAMASDVGARQVD